MASGRNRKADATLSILTSGCECIYSYYRGAVGALLVYDITKPSSFASIARWHREVRENSEATLVLVGNKTDLRHLRAVPTGDAELWASGAGVRFLECSALDGDHVDEAFTALIQGAWDLELRLLLALTLSLCRGFRESQQEGADRRGRHPCTERRRFDSGRGREQEVSKRLLLVVGKGQLGCSGFVVLCSIQTLNSFALERGEESSSPTFTQRLERLRRQK